MFMLINIEIDKLFLQTDIVMHMQTIFILTKTYVKIHWTTNYQQFSL